MSVSVLPGRLPASRSVWETAAHSTPLACTASAACAAPSSPASLPTPPTARTSPASSTAIPCRCSLSLGSVVFVIVFAGVMSLAIAKVIQLLGGSLRVSEREEAVGYWTSPSMASPPLSGLQRHGSELGAKSGAAGADAGRSQGDIAPPTEPLAASVARCRPIVTAPQHA